MRHVFAFFFKLFGWKVVGEVPQNMKKAVITVCPHNSSKDFFVGLGARAVMNRNIGYIGKAELFKPPFGFIFRWLGGTPVKRSKKNNMVADYVETIKSADELMFALAPEGTRKDVDKIKTGFYHIAHGAGIAIIRIGFDFAKKEVIIAEPFYTSGDFEKDMQVHYVPFFEKIYAPKSWVKNFKEGIFL